MSAIGALFSISQHLKIDCQVRSVDVTSGNAKVGFRSMPGVKSPGDSPEVVTVNGLHTSAPCPFWAATIQRPSACSRSLIRRRRR